MLRRKQHLRNPNCLAMVLTFLDLFLHKKFLNDFLGSKFESTSGNAKNNIPNANSVLPIHCPLSTQSICAN